jgi:hypothetical protein
MSGNFLKKALISGALVASLGSVVPVFASAPNLKSVPIEQNTKTWLQNIGNIKISLGNAALVSDNMGNLTATKYTDDEQTAIAPYFQFSNLPADVELSARVTVDNGKQNFVSRQAIKQNRFNSDFYEPTVDTSLSNPGKKHTTVRYEIFMGKTLVGTFTMNYAPASEQPADFIPTPQEGKLDQVQNVHLENGNLSWNAVKGAERYMITVYRYEGDKVVDIDKVESDNLAGTRESIQDIKNFLNLPVGKYRFAVQASKLHNKVWNMTLASTVSEKTDLIAID